MIYLTKWLDMYVNENNKTPLRKGRDYEFQMFGGAILDNLCLINNNEEESAAHSRLVSMFSFSRNAFLVLDSDAILKDEAVIDKSTFLKAKKFICHQFELLSRERDGLGVWYKEGNTTIRTIENYLDTESFNLNLKKQKSWSKKVAAQKITELWSNKKLIDFPNNLSYEISMLFNTITSWST